MLALSASLHAPTPYQHHVPSSTISPPQSRSSSPPTTANSATGSSSMAASASARIAVVGDVHYDWNLEEDRKALEFLQPDLVLFTGDFGNENVELVQHVADLQFPKAVILGNHDAWTTQQFAVKRKDGVQLQLECLGQQHVGYKRLDLPTLKLSVVGGRPFSCGGEHLFRKKLLSASYGVIDMDGSASRIYNAALGSPEDHSVILLAHNGPTGLGCNSNDICGRDWSFGGGDHGDPDLARAISNLKETTNLSIPLVVFGHMHKELQYGMGQRKMIVTDADKTIYLNAAIVPRVKRLIDDEQSTPCTSFTNSVTSLSQPKCRGTLRAFTVVEMIEGRVDKIAETWVSVIGDQTKLEQEHILFDFSIPSPRF